MNDEDLLRATLHARLPGFRARVETAQRVIDEALATIPTPYASFSGGIDSTVLLDLVWQQRPGIPIVWGDDGWDFPGTLAFLAETETRYGFHLIRVRSLDPWRSWCREMERPDLAEAPDAIEQGQPVWGNPPAWDHQWRSLTLDAHPRGGYGGTFMGLLGLRYGKGGESIQRWHVLKGGTRPLYQVASIYNQWHCSPLASWSKDDVWAYAVSRGLAYNPVYDQLAEFGIPLERRRVAAMTCYRVLQYGSHVWLRAGWPELYNKLAVIFPAVRRYG